MVGAVPVTVERLDDLAPEIQRAPQRPLRSPAASNQYRTYSAMNGAPIKTVAMPSPHRNSRQSRRVAATMAAMMTTATGSVTGAEARTTLV